MSEQIKIDSGLKTYDLVNLDGKLLGQLTFNPSDVNIVKRHAEVMRQLEELKKNFNKNVKESSISEDLAELDRIVYEKVDYLLNADVSKTLFSIMGPFSPLASGQFFIENVMDAIGKVIQAESAKKAEKVRQKINKHTAKYHK